MGRIQTNIGLITGMPIGDTVDQLMELAARPRDMLSDRTRALQGEQAALTELMAMLLSVKYVTDNLGKAGLYNKRTATSSNTAALSVSASGSPPEGSYRFTPLQTVQSQQLLSSGFESENDPLGGGRLTFRFGAHVERSTALELFNGGEGIERGTIRITDRSGEAAEIDLSLVQTVEDVLEAINGDTTIDVTAVARGDGFRLVDNTGQTVSNLKVGEVSGGTAASLGLAGIDVAGDVADGQDAIRLYKNISLDELNDGAGVQTNRVFDDVEYLLRDGTTGSIDFSPRVGALVDEEITLADVLDVFNSAAPEKLKAEIAPDGDRLIVTDLTSGDGTFTLTAVNDSGILADLGIDHTSAAGVITGGRILSGTGTVLLSSLGGGTGLGELGSLDLTDRGGASATVDLSAAETLGDVVDAINEAGVGITARVNQARNGIELIDTTGGANNLIVANGDADNTADKLGIAVDDDVTAVNSGDLHLQVVAYNTLLDDLNGGAGVARGKLTIVDSSARRATLDLSGDGVQTVGDVIRKINLLSVNVLAEINDTGDGIRIVDVDHGDGTLEIIEEGNTTAADLHLLADAKRVNIAGELTQVIDGSITYTVRLDDDVTTGTLLDDLNGGAGVDRRTLTIVDTAGEQVELDLSVGDVQTIGDVIEAINQLSVNVYAQVNDSKSGILIKDRADGEGTLEIIEGDGTTAADLHLLVDAEEMDVNGDGELTQVIDGSIGGMVRSLEDIRQAINDLGAGVTAMTFVDGSNKPFRLAISSDRAGKAGELVIDTSQIGFSMAETVAAKDALLVYGQADTAAATVLISSSTNRFQNVLSGVTLEIKQASDTPVTITVSTSDTDLVASVQTMVDNYNKFRERLGELTEYDVETQTGSVLTRNSAALRLDTDPSYLVSGRFAGAGAIKSLAEIGVSLNGDGTLNFDSSVLKSRYAADPEAIEEFFTKEEFGVSDRFDRLIEQLAGRNVSLLAHQLDALNRKMSHNRDRIDFLNERLDVQRERWMTYFYRLEAAIGKMQADLATIESFQPLQPLVLFGK